MVFISMGGTPHSLPDLEMLGKRYGDITFVIAGHYPTRETPSNIRLLPINSAHYSTRIWCVPPML